MGGWIILAILAALVFFAITIYNRLVAGRNRFKNAFAQIDVQLTRRYDLIPNLVETAKGYLKHERETLDAVIKARNNASDTLSAAGRQPGDPSSMQGLGRAEGNLAGELTTKRGTSKVTGKKAVRRQRRNRQNRQNN